MAIEFKKQSLQVKGAIYNLKSDRYHLKRQAICLLMMGASFLAWLWITVEVIPQISSNPQITPVWVYLHYAFIIFWIVATSLNAWNVRNLILRFKSNLRIIEQAGITLKDAISIDDDVVFKEFFLPLVSEQLNHADFDDDAIMTEIPLQHLKVIGEPIGRHNGAEIYRSIQTPDGAEFFYSETTPAIRDNPVRYEDVLILPQHLLYRKKFVTKCGVDIFYHGSEITNLTEFDGAKSAYNNPFGPGIHFSTKQEVAEEYTRSTGKVYTAALIGDHKYALNYDDALNNHHEAGQAAVKKLCSSFGIDSFETYKTTRELITEVRNKLYAQSGIPTYDGREINRLLLQHGIWMVYGSLDQEAANGPKDEGVQYVVLDEKKIVLL